MQIEKIDPEYVYSFNLGYEAAKHLPEMIDQLVKAASETEKGKGFKDGRNQLLFEQTKVKFQTKAKDQEISPDKDRTRDLEPER